MKKITVCAVSIFVCLVLLSGCSGGRLPKPEAAEGSIFRVDAHINMDTIDGFLGREDVCYIDLRMLSDPADYESIGGESDLTATITGFTIVPYPYIATLQPVPVSGAYDGDRLFNVEWRLDGGITSAEPRYEESLKILEELFPRDRAVFLMCGGGGYAFMMRQLLIYLGWDENLVYNIGGNWDYKGDNAVYPLEQETAEGEPRFDPELADYREIDFKSLTPINV